MRCLTLCRLRRGGAGGAAGRKRIGGRPGWEAWRDRPRALPVLVLRKAAGGRPLDAPLSTSMPRSLHPSSPSPALPFPLSRPRNHLRSSPWSPPRIPSFAAWSLVALLLSTGASCGFSLFPFVLFFSSGPRAGPSLILWTRLRIACSACPSVKKTAARASLPLCLRAYSLFIVFAPRWRRRNRDEGGQLVTQSHTRSAIRSTVKTQSTQRQHRRGTRSSPYSALKPCPTATRATRMEPATGSVTFLMRSWEGIEAVTAATAMTAQTTAMTSSRRSQLST